MTRKETDALLMGIAQEIYVDACRYATDDVIDAFVILTKWLRSRVDGDFSNLWRMPDEVTPGIIE